MSRTICQNIIGSAAEMKVMTLEPDLERLLLDSVIHSGNPGAIEPGLAQRLVADLQEKGQEIEVSGQAPVLLTADELRLWLSRFVRNAYDRLKVIAYSEVPGNRQIRVVSSIGQGGMSA